jgi:hypothetical protein
MERVTKWVGTPTVAVDTVSKSLLNQQDKEPDAVSYVYITEPDDVENPVGIQKHPYQQRGWSSNMLMPAPYAGRLGPGGASGSHYIVEQGSFGAVAPTDAKGPLGLTTDQWKKLLIGTGVIVLLYLLFFRKGGVLKNPRGSKGKNVVARVTGSERHGYFYKLMRKGAKKHGPYASRKAAKEAARCAGYRPI